MNLNQLEEKNKKFQDAAVRITELIPGENLVKWSSVMIRSSQRISKIFPNLLNSISEIRFNSVMEKLEEEMDEIVFALDRLTEINKKYKVNTLEQFIKYGFDMLSVYSWACDKIIEKRVSEEI
jgi:hypothetical protein